MPPRSDRRARRAARTPLALLALAVLLTACAGPQPPAAPRPTPFERARPASLLLLPPLNDSLDVHAGAAVLAQALRPLAEAGYYVLSPPVVAQTFHDNGLDVPADIHALPPARLRAVFGADAAVYLRITAYGTRYTVLRSETQVALQARVVDLRDGATLWTGSSAASSADDDPGADQRWLLTRMARALAHQVVATLADEAFDRAGQATQRLLSARPGGIPPGPRAASAPAR